MVPSSKWIDRNLRFAQFSSSVQVGRDKPEWGDLVSQFDAQYKNDKDYRKKVKERSEYAHAIAKAYDLNGPGLYSDTYLRNFLREANNRLFLGEGAKMPTSFNVFRSFIEPNENSFVLNLLDEQHYLIRLNDLLEYITGPCGDVDAVKTLSEIEELKIFVINMAGGFSELEVPGYEKLRLCGVAYVREHDELSIMAVLGQSNPNSGGVIIPVVEGTVLPGREFLLGDKAELDLNDENFFGDVAYTPLILMVRIDIERGKNASKIYF